LQFPPDSFLAGRKILVIDNLWNRGRTILAAKGRIEAAGGYPETGVLHWKPQSSHYPDQAPDFYAEMTEDFIHYPWQRIDDSDYRVLAHPVTPLS
jgi:hypoxanthine phosphoribosyltransferase